MPSPPDVGVILVAAGQGVRAGGSTPKQFQPVRGVPMLARALRPFVEEPAVAAIAVVLPAVHLSHLPPWLAAFRSPRVAFVAGGATRTDSVRCGLAALPPVCRSVLVHDAARPFVSGATIRAVIARAREGHAALAAVPVQDTLKQQRADGPVVERTIPRDGLWRAQTPQGFPRELLERVYDASPPSGATDDAMLVEALGEPVALVADSPLNFKITTPDDFRLAEAVATLIP